MDTVLDGLTKLCNALWAEGAGTREMRYLPHWRQICVNINSWTNITMVMSKYESAIIICNFWLFVGSTVHSRSS